MARETKKPQVEALTAAETPISAMTLEEIQREIARVELETKRLGLDQARKNNIDFQERERARHDANQKRMAELAEARRNRYAAIKKCKHRSGGSPGHPLNGGGKNSFCMVSRSTMPDGVTLLLHCGRCDMKLYTPSEKGARQLWFTTYAAEKEFYDRLVQKSEEEGCSEFNTHTGPTFMFKNSQGVPVIPERV